MSECGKVYLVGAGPGDPGLITVRGVECLKRADLVLYDGLVNPLLLRHTRGVAERTSRSVRHQDGIIPQAQVNGRMIAAAREGQTVVRLKGGDPFVFGRGGEEAEALFAAGIPYEVIPGITAATAAAVCAGISLTHRGGASAVALVTGHEDPTKTHFSVDYDVLSKFPGTLVFYMGLRQLDSIVDRLLKSGMDAGTPAAVVCQTTWSSQRMVAGSLSSISNLAKEAELEPPSLIVIGSSVALRPAKNWFESRPLVGLSIGVARADEQCDAVISQIVDLGGDPVPMPLIQILPPERWDEVDATIEHLEEFDWLVFSSANGVRGLLGRVWEQGGDARRIGRAKIAVIGPATAEALREFGLRADLVPAEFRAERLGAELAPQAFGKKILWARANRGRDVLPTILEEAGAQLEQVIVYRNEDVPGLQPDVLKRLAERRLDWIAMSSPSIAQGVARVLSIERRSGIRFAAISPVTAAAAEGAGLHVDAIATTFTWDGLLKAISRARGSAD
jgi:uroporphyrinogen III methyltransferase/synthase